MNGLSRLLWAFLLLGAIWRLDGAEIGASIGDGAVSQILRHAAAKLLDQPRIADILLKTRDNPKLDPLASVEMINHVEYRNLSVLFHDESIHMVIDRLSIKSETEISDMLWPIGLGDKVIHTNLDLYRGEVRFNVDQYELSLADCQMNDAALGAAVTDHWIADKGASVLASLLSPMLDSTLCAALKHYVGTVEHTQVGLFPVHDLVPEKAKKFLTDQNTTLFYRLKSVKVDDHQLTVMAQLEWNDLMSDEAGDLLDSSSSNSSLLDMELHGDDRVTVWVEDSIINSLLSQVDWSFEWMNEQIPVSSPVIPPDSREFLSTLCTECYFQVNVAAHGQPILTATNESLVLEKSDRVHLRVVNPNKNVTSVFVAFVLTINAEIRPSFDEGTLRTLVQLLDTNITMESGAFPKTWGLFMQDLMRGMILDMLWPEIKMTIEEFSYGKGVRISKACGLDPNEISMEIGEGNFALSSRLNFRNLDPEKCLKELKNALPNTSKLFNKAER